MADCVRPVGDQRLDPDIGTGLAFFRGIRGPQLGDGLLDEGVEAGHVRQRCGIAGVIFTGQAFPAELE